jgi:DNA-binding transcriptional MerR regulator
MTISEVAKIVSLTPVTLRYYERVGLLKPIKRNNNGVRDYTEEDIQWIDFIKCMRSAGLSVESLIEYNQLYQQGEETKEARKQLLLEERENLRQRFNELQNSLARLDSKIRYYEE